VGIFCVSEPFWEMKGTRREEGLTWAVECELDIIPCCEGQGQCVPILGGLNLCIVL
jgi:hypothetical protein